MNYPDFSQISDELLYVSYAVQRSQNPTISPERWAAIGFRNVPEMEARYQAELAIIKAKQ